MILQDTDAGVLSSNIGSNLYTFYVWGSLMSLSPIPEKGIL